MAMTAHDEYYHNLKREAIAELARVAEEPHAETCSDAREQLCKVLEYGEAEDIACAIDAFVSIKQAHHELKEHKHEGVVLK